MYLTITIKAEADSQAELINHFASNFDLMRGAFEELKEQGILGPPDKVDLRFVIVGGGWREPVASAPQAPIILE